MAVEVPKAISDAIDDLWDLRARRPDNRFESPQFLCLQTACQKTYGVGGQFWFSFSLSEILRSLGCPMYLPKDRRHLALPAEEAAQRLHLVLTAKTARVVHLCPLDWADDPPALSFGENRLGLFSSAELQTIADAPRLARAFPNRQIDWNRLSQFYWLIVDEQLSISTEPGQRTSPFMYEIMGDLGAIEAHENRFPEPVERVLFLLLLAPWEDWSEAEEVDWRGFRIPWVYSVSDDLCVSLKTPPSEDDLTLVPKTYTDFDGQPVDIEEPGRFSTSDAKAGLRDIATDAAWSDLDRALGSPLFAPPIRHFLVRAYHAQGIDEFIAHLTVLEAALGLQSDYGKKPKGDPRAGRSVTRIMAERVAALLADDASAAQYEELFDLRSAYVHGRLMKAISSIDRFRARRLARRVVVALIEAALGINDKVPFDREQYLVSLRASPMKT